MQQSELVAVGSERQREEPTGALLWSSLNTAAVPRLCTVTLFGYRFNNQVSGSAFRQLCMNLKKKKIIMNCYQSFQRCYFQQTRCCLHSTSTAPFSSSDPGAVESWSKPGEPATGLFWIKRRRSEFQLPGVFSPLPVLALLIVRMLQLACF